ncbi:hypothetical protein PHSC3_001856 [Chlamydiales bacterium STE3]|nr:hypothetical protein PHSC3_001856 [Chlamydiales bacterium STE3]
MKISMANKRFSKSKKKALFFQGIDEYLPQSKGCKKLLELSKKMFFSEEHLKRTYLLKNQQVALKAAAGGIPTIRPVGIKGIGVLKAYRFVEGGIVEGEILPTSHLVAFNDPQVSGHLVNTFSVIVEGRDRAIIRSGRIASKQKAKDFVQLLFALREEIIAKNGDEKFVLQERSHQLNSFEMETRFIANQHKFLAYMAQKLRNKVEIAHINTPKLRFYEWSKKLERLPASLY